MQPQDLSEWKAKKKSRERAEISGQKKSRRDTGGKQACIILEGRQRWGSRESDSSALSSPSDPAMPLDRFDTSAALEIPAEQIRAAPGID